MQFDVDHLPQDGTVDGGDNTPDFLVDAAPYITKVSSSCVLVCPPSMPSSMWHLTGARLGPRIDACTRILLHFFFGGTIR